ncbi:hypothetical protein [Lichenibacterium dinghuense]|uniref:hypothetical protein n=1 Tax=Lichenibacterium dinghuense TaxID=2895977 RepID=UPI001F19CA4F|nr:hypothetical protein [Lichenibacterium sp. 6Y81]
MGDRIRAFEWATMPSGAVPIWPSPLKTLVRVMLAAKQPIFVAWGPDLTMLYNDSYVELLGSKHPDALGTRFMRVWAEIRDDLQPLVDQVYAGEPVHMDDIALMVDREGRSPEAHFAVASTELSEIWSRRRRAVSRDVEGSMTALSMSRLSESEVEWRVKGPLVFARRCRSMPITPAEHRGTQYPWSST